MKYLQLQYFCTIAKHESYTKAAAELLIAQPSLSRSMRLLEEELGVVLFQKTGRKIILSPEGRAFYEKVAAGLALIEKGVAELKENVNTQVCSLSILVLAASTYMQQFYIHFVQKHPDIKLCFLRQNWDNVYCHNNFDVCIAADPIQFDDCSSIVLREERLNLAVLKKNPISEKEKVSLQELESQPFIMYQEGYPIRRLTENILNQAGIHPKSLFECDNNTSFCSMISAGVGVALVPEYTMPLLNNPSIVRIPVLDKNCKRRVLLLYRKNPSNAKSINAFKNECIAYFQSAHLHI